MIFHKRLCLGKVNLLTGAKIKGLHLCIEKGGAWSLDRNYWSAHMNSFQFCTCEYLTFSVSETVLYWFQDVKDSADKKSYEFWSTQPVPKIDEEITTNEAIEPDLSIDKLRQQPYSLPAGFHWDTLNLDDPIVVSKNYMAIFKKERKIH